VTFNTAISVEQVLQCYFFLIVKPKEIHILLRNSQNTWKMEMRLPFRKCAWVCSDYNIEWIFQFIPKGYPSIVRLRPHCLLENAKNKSALIRIIFLKIRANEMFWVVSMIGPNCQRKQRAGKQTYFVTV